MAVCSSSPPFVYSLAGVSVRLLLPLGLLLSLSLVVGCGGDSPASPDGFCTDCDTGLVSDTEDDFAEVDSTGDAVVVDTAQDPAADRDSPLPRDRGSEPDESETPDELVDSSDSATGDSTEEPETEDIRVGDSPVDSPERDSREFDIVLDTPEVGDRNRDPSDSTGDSEDVGDPAADSPDLSDRTADSGDASDSIGDSPEIPDSVCEFDFCEHRQVVLCVDEGLATELGDYCEEPLRCRNARCVEEPEGYGEPCGDGCPAALVCVSDICLSHEPGEAGDTCWDGSECAESSPTCIDDACHEGAEGDPCRTIDDCRFGLGCDGDPLRCKVGGFGATCTTTDQCDGSLVCGVRVCQSGDVGDPCTEDAHCGPSTVCGPDGCQTGSDGNPCSETSHCADSYFCNPNSEVCRPRAAETEDCESDEYCQAGLFCGPEDLCQDGSWGDDCEDATHCQTGLVCGFFGCTVGGPGTVCRYSEQCGPTAPICALSYCQTGVVGDPCEVPEHCSTEAPFCVDGRCRSGIPGDSCTTDATCQSGLSCTDWGCADLVAIPPDPATVAPPIEPDPSPQFLSTVSFLFEGGEPIQRLLDVESLEEHRAAVIRGRVTGRDGGGIGGVMVSIHDGAPYGFTLTRADGMFDLVVNGGGLLRVRYQKEGFVSAHRNVEVPWNDFVWADDVVLLELDPVSTVVDLSEATSHVARGSESSDADGERQATLFFPEGTSAIAVQDDGSEVELENISVRITEFTVGESGPDAMPAPLPPASMYTYAVEYSVDEALEIGTEQVEFSEPGSP